MINGVASSKDRWRWVAIIAALLMAAMAMMSVPARAAANAIQNGDFSQGLTGWPTTTVAAGSFSGYPRSRRV